MKRVIYLFIAFAFFSCEKDVFVSDQNGAVSVAKTKSFDSSEIPNISIKDGYLVLKNYDVLDSLRMMCDQMEADALKEWETQVGFESAYSHFKIYFDLSDSLNTAEDYQSFKNLYGNAVKISQDKDGWDIDYPFLTDGLETLLSKEGKIQIGNSLWVFKADRKIFIHDCTAEKIKKYEDAVNTVSNQKVVVLYHRSKGIQSRIARESDAICLATTPAGPENEAGGYIPLDGRKYFWSLDILKHEYSENGVIKPMRELALFQKTLKNGSTYKTRYKADVHSLNFGYEPNQRFGTTVQYRSSEVKGGHYYYLGYVKGDKFPNFRLIMTHFSRGITEQPLIGNFGQGANYWEHPFTPYMK